MAEDQITQDRKKISGALRQSGLPFQLAVKAAIEENGWRVGEEEFPWRDPNGRDQFLDLVAERDDVLATIECKKTTQKAYVFLADRVPRESQRIYAVGSRTLQGVEPRVAINVGIWHSEPPSVESTYCVVAGGDKGDHLLEPDAQLLIRGTDAYAIAYRNKATKADNFNLSRLFAPLLVTNTPMYLVSVDPATISLESGTFAEVPPEAKLISFIRFRKSFTAGAKSQPSDRTVLVTHVSALEEVLADLGQSLMNPGDQVWRLA